VGRDVDGSTMGKMMILRKEKNYLLQYIIVKEVVLGVFTPRLRSRHRRAVIILRCAVSVAPQINLSVPSRAAARRPRAGVYRAVQGSTVAMVSRQEKKMMMM